MRRGTLHANAPVRGFRWPVLRPHLWLSILLAGVVALAVPLPSAVQASALSEFDVWGGSATIAGQAIFTGMTTAQMDAAVDKAIAQGATVIEADSNLSEYLTDAQYAQELSLITAFTSRAHAKGMKVVWYMPTLESNTTNGKNLAHTMYKDHPTWAQIGLDGTPNVFYGGSGQVFWVEKNMESVWLSPTSAYRDYFIDRVKKLVATGVDGLWADVPIYADFGPTQWVDRNPAAIARFLADTGMAAPTVVNWNDPVWRRWISWRHEELARLLTDVAAAAQAINPQFPIIAETLPTDYNGATIYGLDAGYLKDVPGVTHVFEVDAMSNNSGFRAAQEDDWISLISALKYTKAASGDKPSWVFTYGKQVDDAEAVMAEAVAAGNNPYELMVPEMTSTVGDGSMRTRLFTWIQANRQYLFERDSAARVAVLYSSSSRDFVDKFAGLGMFTTTNAGGDDLFWSNAAIDSAYQRDFLAEFRGMVELLVNNHIPFDTLVAPSAAELARYDVVMLPDVEAIPNGEAALLDAYALAGGRLIVTGPNPTALDEHGTGRTEYALASALGFGKADALPTSKVHAYGAGEVRYRSARLGKSYFVTGDPAAESALLGDLAALSATVVTTTADPRVHFEFDRSAQDLVLQMTNFIGADGTFAVAPTAFSVTLALPAGTRAVSVGTTSPDAPGTAVAPIPYVQGASSVTFDVSLNQWAMVVVGIEPTVPPVVPGAPTGVQGTPREGSVDLSWIPPASNGGSPITGYQVQVYQGASATPSGPPLASPGTGTTLKVTGLTNGTGYRFDVAAVNAVGTGPASAKSALVTPAFAPPGAVTGVAGVAGPVGGTGLGSVTLTWAAASTGAAPITSYEVQKALDAPTPAWVSAGSVPGTATKFDVTGLAAGASWVFRVRAVNAGGPGPWSLPSAPVRVALAPSVPGAPSGLVGTAAASSVVLSWTAPTDDGGSPITGYRVQVYEGASGTPSGTPLDSPGTGRTLTVTGLTNGTTYRFDVAAVNAVGTGPASAKSAPVTPVAPAPPAPPPDPPAPPPDRPPPPAPPAPPPAPPAPPPDPGQSSGGSGSPSSPVVAPAQPADQPPSLSPVTCTARAVSGGTKIRVDVNPNLPGGQNYSFRLQKMVKGDWVPYSKAHGTKGGNETRTVNVPKGTWRAECYPATALQAGAMSKSVKIKR